MINFTILKVQHFDKFFTSGMYRIANAQCF